MLSATHTGLGSSARLGAALLASASLLLLGAGGWGCSEGTPVQALPGAGRRPVPTCSGDNDGRVAVGELDFSPGGAAPYAVQPASAESVEPSGAPEEGRGVWDFRGATFDHLQEVPLQDPAGSWYGELAFRATLAMPLSTTNDGTTDAYLILRATEEALLILGAASPEPDEFLLLYDDEVPMLRFPLAEGDRWTQRVGAAPGSTWQDIDLEAAGLVDQYSLEVRGRGRLLLPGMFIDNVLWVQMTLDRSVPGQPDLQVTETFLVHECLGTVARRSEPGGPWWVVWYPM